MIKKCINGHYYDGDKFPICPHCGAGDEMPAGTPQPAPPAVPPQGGTVYPSPLPQFQNDDDDDATVPLAFLQKNKPQPVKAEEEDATVPMTPPQPVKAEEEDATVPMTPPQPVKAEEEDATVPMTPQQPVKAEEEDATVPMTPPQSVKAEEEDATVPMTPQQPVKAEEATTALPMTPPAAPTAAEQTIQAMPQPSSDIPQAQQPAPAQPYNSLLPPLPYAPQTTYQQPQAQQTTYQQPQASYQPQPAYQPDPYAMQQPTLDPYNRNPYDAGYMNNMTATPSADRNTPTVGWLVGLSGACYGESFELKSGKNFIGRNPDMDIALTMDNSVAPYRHAVVLFEPKESVFLALPGEAREMLYVNDEAVITNKPLKAFDKLTVGSSKLLFFPLCSDTFSWDKQ